MKEVSFAEIKDAENGQQIPSFQGTVKKVFDQLTGDGQYGTWWLQNIILEDKHANEITITWNSEDCWDKDKQGRTFIFESGYDKKEQLCGLKKSISKRNGKIYESIKVDDRAKIIEVEPAVLGGGGSSGNDQPVAGRVQPDKPPPNSSLNGEIEKFAAYSRKVFERAWIEAGEWIKTLPQKDAEDLSVSDYYDFRMRVAQHIAIETAKIIRRERF